MCGLSAQTSHKNLSASNVFFFDLFSNQSFTPDSTSHYFIITESNTASTAASTTSSVSTTSTAISAVSQNTSSATAISEVSVTGGLSPDAKIGIGVGISIPMSLAIGALLGWFLYRRRAKRIHAGDLGPGATEDNTSNSSMKTPSHIIYMPGGEGEMQYMESKYGHGSHLSPARHGSYRVQQVSPQLSNHIHENAPAQHDSYNSQQMSPQITGYSQFHIPAQLDSEATTGSESRAYELL